MDRYTKMTLDLYKIDQHIKNQHKVILDQADKIGMLEAKLIVSVAFNAFLLFIILVMYLVAN